MDNLAHKMLHTFEKMDAINPTFEKTRQDKDTSIRDLIKRPKAKRIIASTFYNFNQEFGL